MRDMKYYIYTCESDGSEAPLTMIDGKIIEFETEARAAAFLNELKHSSIFDEESEEFKQLTSKAFIKSAIVFCDDGYIDADAAEKGAFGYIISEKVKMAEKIEELLDKHYLIDDNKSYGYEEYGTNIFAYRGDLASKYGFETISSYDELEAFMAAVAEGEKDSGITVIANGGGQN